MPDPSVATAREMAAAERGLDALIAERAGTTPPPITEPAKVTPPDATAITEHPADLDLSSWGIVKHGVTIAGKTIPAAALGGISRIISGLHDMVRTDHSASYLDQYRSQGRGALRVLGGALQLGFSPSIGTAAGAYAMFKDKYPELDSYVIATKAAAQGMRDVMGGGMPIVGPQGLTILRPMELLQDHPGEFATTVQSVTEYGKDAAPLTVGELVHNGLLLAASYAQTKAMGAVKNALTGEGKVAPKPTQPTTPGKPGETAAPPEDLSTAEPAAAEPVTAELAQQRGGNAPAGTYSAKDRPFPTPDEIRQFMAEAQTNLPPGGEPAPRAFGINWQTLGTDESVNRVTMAIAKQNYEATDAALAAKGLSRTSEGFGGLVQTHAMTKAQAANVPWSVPEVLDGTLIRPGETASVIPARIAGLKATAKVVDKILWQIQDEIQGGVGAPGVAGQDLQTTIALSRIVRQRVKEVESGMGRGMEFLKESDLTGPNGLSLSKIQHQEFNDLVGRMGTEMSPAQTSAYLQTLKNKWGKDAASLWGHGWAEAVSTGRKMGWELWINSMVSNPTTWGPLGVKVLSDTTLGLYSVPQRALMRMNHKIWTALTGEDNPLGTQAGETTAMVRGLVRGAESVPQLMLEGKDVPGSVKWDLKPAITAENAGLSPEGFWGGAFDKAGQVARFPTAAMKGTTTLAQGLNYSMEVSAQAVRQAAMDLRGQEGTPTYAQRFASIVQEVERNPARYELIDQAAKESALRNTLTTPLGPIGQAFSNFANSHPFIKAHLPFLFLPWNATARATNFFPPTWGVSYLWGRMGKQIAQGGAAAEMAMADLEVGAALTLGIAALSHSHHLTGAMPMDPVERANWLRLNIKPYSFYREGYDTPGARGLRYQRALGPLGITIGAITDISEIFAQVPQSDNLWERGLQLGGAIVLGTGQAAKDEPFATAFSRVINAFSDPQKDGEAWLDNWTRSVVPRIWGQFNHTWINDTLKDTQGPLQAWRAEVWGSDLIDRRHPLTGFPIHYNSGIGPIAKGWNEFVPITISEVSPDPVDHEFYREHVPMPSLPRTISGRDEEDDYIQMTPQDIKAGIPLTTQQRDRWWTLMTQEMRNGRGELLYEELYRTIHSASYQKYDHWPTSDVRELELRRIVSTYRAAALDRLKREDANLRVAIAVQRQVERAANAPMTSPQHYLGRDATQLIPGLR